MYICIVYFEAFVRSFVLTYDIISVGGKTTTVYSLNNGQSEVYIS